MRPFVADFNVPIADDDDLEDLTFEATSRKVKAAVQIAGSIFLNLRASVQRQESLELRPGMTPEGLGFNQPARNRSFVIH
jgi:hypothetical protein